MRGKRRGFRVRHVEQAGKSRALAVGFENRARLLDLLPKRRDIGIELCRPIRQRLVMRRCFKAGKRLAFGRLHHQKPKNRRNREEDIYRLKTPL